MSDDRPVVDNFYTGIKHEVEFQMKRWGVTHDTTKTPEDWFWLIGFLAGKALAAQKAGDLFKARHHTISTAAVLAQWHASLSDKKE